MALEKEVCKVINVLIRRISMSLPESIDKGKPLKDLIHYAGQSEDHLKYTHKSLLRHLRRKNSSIRLGVFLIMDAFFRKSSFYRELFLDDVQGVLEATLQHFASGKLPPPSSDVKKLKTAIREKFSKWFKKFPDHARVQIAYNYVETAFKAEDAAAAGQSSSSAATRNQEFIRQTAEMQKKSSFTHVNEGLAEYESEIRDLITEMQNCFALLITAPEDFMGAETESPTEGDSTLKEHGITHDTSIIIDIGRVFTPAVQETKDNAQIVETLKGLYSRGKKRFLPLIKLWEQKISRYASEAEELYAKVKELHDSLVSALVKYEEVSILPMGESDEYASSDFEEVVDDTEETSESAAVLKKVEEMLQKRADAKGSTSKSLLPPARSKK